MKFEKIKEIAGNQKSKILLENFISLSTLQVLNYLLPLITLPYLTRVIGVEMFGILAIAGAIIAYFQTFIDYGFDFSGARDIARCNDNIDEISKIFWKITFTKLLFILISILILIPLLAFIPYFKNQALLIILTFLYVPVRIMFPEWFFQGMQQMKYITLLNVVARVLFTLLIFVFITERNDYLYQPILVAGGYLISGIFSIFLIVRHFKIKMYYPSFREIKSTIAGSRDIFYNQLLPNLYNSFSTLLLGYWWGNASAGILEAAKRVINLSDQALSVLSRTFFPFLAKNLSKHNLFLKLSLAASIGFALIYIFGANVIVKLLYSKEFYEARLIIILMSISPILFALMNAYGTNYLILINKEKLLRNITVISSLIGFVLALVLIYYFKTYGAALTIIISRSLIGGLSFYFSRKLILSTQKL